MWPGAAQYNLARRMRLTSRVLLRVWLLFYCKWEVLLTLR